MKRLLIVFATLLFTVLSSASQAQVLSWTGPYVGAFGGYGWGTQGQHDNGVPVGCYPQLNCVVSDGQYNLSGALGGGVVGYSMPLSGMPSPLSPLLAGFPFYNQAILGLEGDIAGSDLSGSSSTCGTIPHTCGGDIYMMSDIRVRLGLPFGQFMPFFAGGLAVDDVHAYDVSVPVSATHIQAGWTVGGGLEYKVTDQLSLRAEYLYQALPRTTFFDIAPGVPEGIRENVNVVRAGIVWNFSPPPPPPPVVAKY
jgi:outer membrane immunogenic protein